MLKDLYQCLRRCFFFLGAPSGALVVHQFFFFFFFGERLPNKHVLFFSSSHLTFHLNSNAYLFTHMNRWVSRNLLNFVLRQLSLLQFSCLLSGMFCNKSVFVGLVSYFVNLFSCLYFLHCPFIIHLTIHLLSPHIHCPLAPAPHPVVVHVHCTPTHPLLSLIFLLVPQHFRPSDWTHSCVHKMRQTKTEQKTFIPSKRKTNVFQITNWFNLIVMPKL